MKKIVLLLLVTGLTLSCTSQNELLTVYVSVDGASINDGSEASPFGTLTDAVAKVIQLKSEKPDADVMIQILAGEYYASESINITPALNGLTIKGAGAEQTVLKGSRFLALEWSTENDSIYTADVPADLNFEQFIVNSEPQILARYPNYDEEAQYWNGFAEDALSTKRLATWEKPKGAYFHALHGGRWGGFHWRITGMNEDGTPVLEGGHQNNRGSEPHAEYRMVENVLEELDSPGEWYLDSENHKLYYWPTKNVTLDSAKFEVAVLKDLIQIKGSLENPVKNVSISGIKFEHTTRTFMEIYEPLLRSDWTIYRGAAIFLEGTEDCSIQNCEFTNLGGNVIMASSYTKGLLIKGNHIHDCGASAVSFIGDPAAVRSPSFNYGEYMPLTEIDTLPGPKSELYPRDCVVEDNLIHRIGRIEKQTAGVQISMAMRITVRHNSIYDVPRSGINIGDGTWGGHILEYNDVFNTVLETSDHGSFNSWGRDRFWFPNRSYMDSLTTAKPDMPTWDAIETTVIRNNRFRCDHGWDIDLDDGSSNYHIYNNLCLNNGIKLREGFSRTVENNIMVNNSLHPHVWFAKSEDVFKHNILGDAYQDVRLNGWGKELDYNFFPTQEAMLKSQIYDRDTHSAFGNPGFKNPEVLDFSVPEDSPALKIGFKNFPMDKFGVQDERLKAMAKTPEVPEFKEPSDSENKETPVVAWLRNNLKNVDSEQEQSAYGLPSAEGVIVLKVWNDSPAVKNNGLKKGDVILQAGGKPVTNITDFFKINLAHDKSKPMQLTIMRNQSEKTIAIQTQ